MEARNRITGQTNLLEEVGEKATREAERKQRVMTSCSTAGMNEVEP